MSASKLEKKIWNLEMRLRQEFQKELTEVYAKLDYLEAQVMTSTPENLKGFVVSEGDVQTEMVKTVAPKPRVSHFNPSAVVPMEEGAETEATGRPERWIPLEPVAFLESTWNLVLVLGYTESGWLDVIIAGLMLLISAGLQVTFSIILLSKDFLGDPFDDEVSAAKSWRRKVAHDYKHMDLARTSLVSRVCNQADGLIVSNDQASLIGQINAFLGLQQEDFVPDGLRPGILLCMLCILLWCLYLCNEFRMIFVSMEAICQVPRGWRTKVDNGRFITMSYLRFGSYILMRLARSTIAGLLLYAGIVWLANTTSISDLILNAVALGAVLDVDEMFFAALMPKKIQIKIQDLEAIKVTYSKRRSECESVLLVLAMVALMIVPWHFLVEPLGASMQEVKAAYCAGHQDFVVGLNENLGVPIGMSTTSFSVASTNTSLIEFSVDEFLKQEDITTSDFIRFAFSTSDFETKRTETVLTTATNMLLCADLDEWYLNDVYHEYKTLYAPLWWSVATGLNLPPTSTCAEMAGYCDTSEGQLLRMVCPLTCGCTSTSANPWYKVTAQGCPTKCSEIKEAGLSELTTCADTADEDFDWVDFWDAYPDIMSTFLTLEDAASDSSVAAVITFMKTNNSCTGLSTLGDEPLTQGSWCAGKDDLWSPLAYLCPVTCLCQDEEAILEKPAYCPNVCTCQDSSKAGEVFLTMHIPYSEDGEEIVETCAQAVELELCEDMSVNRMCSQSCGLC